jgi:hypothetical protein
VHAFVAAAEAQEASPWKPVTPVEGRNAQRVLDALLALMLERKKMLRPVESRDDDMLVYEHVVTRETIVIANPHLSFDQIPDVQREVGALLEPGA